MLACIVETTHVVMSILRKGSCMRMLNVTRYSRRYLKSAPLVSDF